MYLGIDFGTSFTKAAVFNPATRQTTMVQLNSISLDNGVKVSEYIMPTAVYVKPLDNGKSEFSVGYEAINRRLLPEGVFYEKFKPRLDAVPGSENYRAIDVQLVSIVLKSIRLKANQQFGQDFKSAVLTIPASAPKDGPRWNLMMKSAENAGFTDVVLIAEPEAAAYCLLGEKLHSGTIQDNSYFLIYDFGGGTFDTSIVRVCDQQIFVENESVGSDNSQRWGGIYVDDMIKRDYIRRSPKALALAKKLQTENMDVATKRSVSDHFRTEPVKAKICLSANASFKNFYQDYVLNRQNFENMVEPMIDSTIDCAVKLVESTEKDEGKLDFSKISYVFLVGGTSKIPLVTSLWERTRIGKRSTCGISTCPLEVVAQGAAKYNYYKISDRKLITEGKKKVANGEYRTAAKYFNDSNSDEGLFYVAVLYYAGVLNFNRKREYAKARRIFIHIATPQAAEMLSVMYLLGQGVRQNKEKAKKFIEVINDKTTLCDHIINVIAGTFDPADLDAIYRISEEPLKMILSDE